MKVRTGARVAEVMEDGVRLADGEIIASEHLVVWCAGVKAPAFFADIDGLETNRINQLVVRPTLRRQGTITSSPIGDCASCPREGFPQPVPPRAQAAHQMADFMVKQMNDRLAGRALQTFSYRDFGSLVVGFGKFSTVGSLIGLVGPGFPLKAFSPG